MDERTMQPVTNVEWLARRGKPASLWLWDHPPSELEILAYVEGMAGKVELPQMVVPLRWDAAKREYEGTFVLPGSGRWYFRLGTLVPDALRPAMEADFDYGGPILPIDIPAPGGSLYESAGWLIGSAAFTLGGGLAVFLLRWRSRLTRKHPGSRPAF
jgi:hypothetical protein